MKVLKRAKMPDETVIQLEDWREDFLFEKTLEIGAYPKAKNVSKNGIIRVNENFRLNLVGFKNDEETKGIFNKLEKGTIKLEDLQEHFYNLEDKFYLGISNC